jgi:hypothetical protein
MTIEQKFMPADAPDQLAFVAEQEPWNIYRLENGSIIRAKIVLARIEETGQFEADGAPRYLLKWQHVIDASFPEHLKAKS